MGTSTPEQTPPAHAQGRPPGLPLAVCFGVPLTIIVVCYTWLALDRGTPWLWNVPVHESGRYTLAQTIFYFSHFLREIPTDVMYALFALAGASAVARGTGATTVRSAHATRIATGALLAAAALIAFALFQAAAEQGWDGALRDLLQLRTRDDLVAYGSHWRFHWLSTLWFGAAVWLLAPTLLRVRRGPVAARADQGAGSSAPPRDERAGQSRGAGANPDDARAAKRLAWGVFVLLTVVFGLSSDVFFDVRYTGHQAREIMTHGPVTALLAMGVVRMTMVSSPHTMDVAAVPGAWRRSFFSWLATALAFIIPLWLAVVTLAGDVMAAGQSDQGLAAMVAGHVFEHTLDYALVMLLVAGGSALRSVRRA